jgi:hypothetical protein
MQVHGAIQQGLYKARNEPRNCHAPEGSLHKIDFKQAVAIQVKVSTMHVKNHPRLARAGYGETVVKIVIKLQ